MAKTQIAEFTIYLRDAALVAQLQAQLAAGTGPGALIALPTGGVGVLRGPAPAGAEFGALAGGPALPLIDARHAPPTTGNGYISSVWFADPQYPTDRAVFTLDHTWWIGGATKFYWSGQVALAPGAPVTIGTGVDDLPLQGLATRYWVHGFEQPFDGDQGGISGSGTPVIERRCLAASRTGDGVGARFIIGATTGSYDAYSGSSLRPSRVNVLTEVWERFYVRPLRYGTSTSAFWEVASTNNAGFEIAITPTGQWALYAVPYSLETDGVRTLILTFGQAVLGAWTRFDVFTYLAAERRIVVRVNGLPAAVGSVVPQSVGSHWWSSSHLGLGLRNTPNFCDTEMDFDDWIGGAVPTTQSASVAAWNVATAYTTGQAVTHDGQVYVATAPSTGQTPVPAGSAVWALAADPLDLRHGSHVVRVSPHVYGPAHDPAWVGDVRNLAARGHFQSVTYPVVTSSTPNAVLEVEVPLATRASHPQSLGVAAWRVLCRSQRGGGATLTGTLGYQVGAAAPVVTPLTGEGPSDEYEAMTGQAATGELVPPTETLRLRYVHSSEALATEVSGLAVLVELIGTFGPEDGPGEAATAYPRPVPVHLNSWPRSRWATDALPLSAVIVVGGTYVGNGTGQDLFFKLPPAFLLIRPAVNVSHKVTRWWPSALFAETDSLPTLQFAYGVAVVDTDDAFVPASDDADQRFQARVRLTGTPSNQSNEPGVTYQYCALLDPAGRFSRAFGTSARPVGSTASPGVPRTWPLDDLTFVPEVAYGMNERTLGLAGADPGHVWKSPGHAASAAMDVNAGTAYPSGLTFGAGALTVGTGLIPDGAEQSAMILFRRLDGNDAVPRVVFAGSYVGDGTASRTITFGTTGRRPFYAHVGSISGTTQLHRDPSHTTVNSSNIFAQGVTASTTGITAGGPDSFTVGAALNANGITYGYWGLYGSEAAGNNGWSTNGEFVTPADSNNPPGWVEPEVIDPDPGGPGPDPGPGDYPVDPGAPGSDIFAECVEASTRIVNLALSEIGITKQITSLGATDDDPPVWIDNSQEAYAARMVYRTLVDTVLRDDDWAFTREYATLTATAGTREAPVNPDWTYSYTLPVDCLRVKRICTPETQRRYSTEPVAFDRRSASLGYVDVLLTNEPGGGLLPEPAVGAPRTVTIEYAKRISCAARVSDAQFRECLVFRLAAGLAKALSRDAADADRCLRNYHLVRPRALVNQANDQEPQRPSRGLPDWTTGR